MSVLSLQASSNTLSVYRTGLTRGVDGTNQLVYVVEVTNGSSIRDLVFVHANAGKLVNRYSLVGQRALPRPVQSRTPQLGLAGGTPSRAASTSTSATSSTSRATRIASSPRVGPRLRTTVPARGCGASTTTRRSRARTRTGTAPRPTTATASRLTTSSRTSGATRTRSTRTPDLPVAARRLNESYSDIWGETVDMLNGVGTGQPRRRPLRRPLLDPRPRSPVLIINSPQQRCAPRRRAVRARRSRSPADRRRRARPRRRRTLATSPWPRHACSLTNRRP